MIDRRRFIRGIIAAPAIVAVGSLMPIRGVAMVSDFSCDNLLVKATERYSYGFNSYDPISRVSMKEIRDLLLPGLRAHVYSAEKWDRFAMQCHEENAA